MGLVSTSAVVLRTHPYGDSSLVVKSLTEELGVQTFMARGVRARGGKGGAAPEVFSTGVASFYHRAGREMHTLRAFEPSCSRRGLVGSMVRFSGAALLAELILRHLGAEGQTGLHRRMERALDRLAACPEADVATVVLAECWGVVGALGYRPEIDRCVHCARAVQTDEMGRFDFGLGGVLCSDCGAGSNGPRIGPGARAQLLALSSESGESTPDIGPHVRGHLQLLSDFVTYHVSGAQPLPAFGYFASFLEAADG